MMPKNMWEMFHYLKDKGIPVTSISYSLDEILGERRDIRYLTTLTDSVVEAREPTWRKSREMNKAFFPKVHKFEMKIFRGGISQGVRVHLIGMEIR